VTRSATSHVSAVTNRLFVNLIRQLNLSHTLEK